MPRIGVIGHGAIGSVVADAILRGDIGGATLSGVALRPARVGESVTGGPAVGVDELIAASDIVVESAGAQMLQSHGVGVLSADKHLVVVSSGALLDDTLLHDLIAAGGERLHVCAGAVGGLDLVRAAAAMGPIQQARITTTKKPAGLVQDHMTDGERSELLALTEVTTLFAGEVPDLVARFPASTNVAASLALAVGSVELVEGRVVADPGATRTTHVIELAGAAGDYRFEMTNHPSPANPRSSGIVPWSVVCVLRDLCGSSWTP